MSHNGRADCQRQQKLASVSCDVATVLRQLAMEDSGKDDSTRRVPKGKPAMGSSTLGAGDWNRTLVLSLGRKRPVRSLLHVLPD
jgi:hypothetical protein